QQCAQRRAGSFDRLVFEVQGGDALMRGRDVFHAVRKAFQILDFGAQHFIGQNDIRVGKDASEEETNEALVDAVAEDVGGDGFAVDDQVLAAFQVTFADHEFRVPFIRTHAAPYLGHEQADVVVYPEFRADI